MRSISPNPRFAGLVAAAAFAFATILAAPSASAEPKQTENEIKSGCADAGGTYSTTVRPGSKKAPPTRFSQCSYPDIKGDMSTDSYQDGKYLGTQDGDCGSVKCGGPA
jgi:hypothetical protein